MSKSESLLVLIISILSTIWVVYVFISLLILWQRRNMNEIKIRNPPLLLMVGLNSALSVSIVSSKLASNWNTCHLYLFWANATYSLHCAPIIAKGFQYIVLTKDSYRVRFRKFKSNIFLFKLCMMFFMISSLFYEVLWWTWIKPRTKSDGCVLDWLSGSYALVMLATIVFVTIKISALLPWEYDSFNICKELKKCYIVWATLGSLMVLYSVALSFLSNLPQEVEAIIGIFMEIVTFQLMIANPLYLNFTSSKLKSRYSSSRQSIPQRDMWKNVKIFPSRGQETNAPTGAAEDQCCYSSFHEFSGGLLSSPDDVNTILDHFFNNNRRRCYFHDFAKRNFVPEISKFLDDVHSYKQESSFSKLDEAYKAIVSKFIQQNAPFEINISAQDRAEILQYQEESTEQKQITLGGLDEVFDSACVVMFGLLHSNFCGAC